MQRIAKTRFAVGVALLHGAHVVDRNRHGHAGATKAALAVCNGAAGTAGETRGWIKHACQVVAVFAANALHAEKHICVWYPGETAFMAVGQRRGTVASLAARRKVLLRWVAARNDNAAARADERGRQRGCRYRGLAAQVEGATAFHYIAARARRKTLLLMKHLRILAGETAAASEDVRVARERLQKTTDTVSKGRAAAGLSGGSGPSSARKWARRRGGG